MATARETGEGEALDPSDALARPVLAYLDILRVERGCSPHTLSGYRRDLEIDVVRDGTDVITRLAEGPAPHLLLLDLHMPRMTGLTVLQTLRADARFVGLPVVVLSASLAAGDEQDVRAAGGSSLSL